MSYTCIEAKKLMNIYIFQDELAYKSLFEMSRSINLSFGKKLFAEFWSKIFIA